MQTPAYSNLVTCIYDQSEPVGRLGRGAHYSVFRTVQFRSIGGDALTRGRIHDIAVIWDEDHDVRIVKMVERLHLAGLLWPVSFVGERKGVLTVLFDYMAGPLQGGPDDEDHLQRVRDMAQNYEDDCWICEFGWFHRSEAVEEPNTTRTAAIIADTDERVIPYLQGIDVLFQLGEKRETMTASWGAGV